MKTTRKTPKRPSHNTPPKAYEAETHLRNFCSATSHELSNAIGAIVGELDYALSTPSQNVRNRAMTVALRAAEKALSLARNLRYFAVHTRLDIHSVDISQVLLDSVDLLEAELEAKKVEMEVFVEASTYATVDPSALQQVILNLLSNAGNAMPTGGTLRLTLAQKDRFLEIACTDTGVGIAPEKLERIFEPTLSSEETPHFKQDEGLGLAVSKALIEAHGGEIAVTSELGKGTTFTLKLPFSPESPKPSPFLEKRRFRRVHLSLPVEVTIDGKSIQTELTTLSVGGCFARIQDSQHKLPETNAPISLRISYYDDQILEIPKARVASRVTDGVLQGIGIEFLEVDSKGQRLLAAIVKSHST